MGKSYADKIRYERKSKNKQMTRHHIVPSSRGGSDDDINIRMLQRRRHKGLHDYFDNKVPHEQIMQVLEDSNSVLTRKFKKSILEVLEEYGYENMVYENGVFRHK